MFSTMIADLTKGLIPAPGPLGQRLQAAMVKKLAMMRLQRQFHHNDSKINPNTEHMLWAATLLEDKGAIEILVAIFITEAHDRYSAQQGAMDACPCPPELAELLGTSFQTLLALSSDTELNHFLKQKIKKTSVFKELPMIKI